MKLTCNPSILVLRAGAELEASLDFIVRPYPKTKKRSLVIDTCNSSIQEMEAEGSRVHSCPWLQRKWEASLGYLSSNLKIREREERGGGREQAGWFPQGRS